MEGKTKQGRRKHVSMGGNKRGGEREERYKRGKQWRREGNNRIMEEIGS